MKFCYAIGVSLLALLAAGGANAKDRLTESDIKGMLTTLGQQLQGTSPNTFDIAIGKQIYDEANGDLTVEDLRFVSKTNASNGVFISKMMLDDLAIDQGGAASFANVMVSDVAFKFSENGTVFDSKLPAIEIKDGRIPTTLVNNDYIATARAVAWQSFTIAPMEGTVKGERGRIDVAFKSNAQEFGKVADGMIEKARTFGFEGSGIVPKEGSDTETTKVTFAVGDQEIEGLSLTAYAAFFTGVGEREERPLLPMLKRASAGKMSFKIDGLVDMTFDGAEISDMTLKPLRIGYGQLLTKLLSGEEPKLGPDGDPEDMRLFGIMMEDLPDMMQVKSFVYRTLNGKIEGDQPGTFRIGAIEGENLGSVSYGRLSFKDFVLDVPDAKGKLELFEVRDLDLGGVYKILGGLVRSRFVPNFTVIERNMPNLGQWVLKGLELDVPKEGGRIALANARFGMGRWIGVFPESISIGFDGLVIPAAAMKDTSPPSPSDLGYEQLNMAGGLDIKYDSDRSAYVVGPVFLSGQDMGTFTFNAQIGGISKVLMSVASVAGAVMSGGGQYLSAVTFDGAMVEVSNAEIIRRVLDWQAKAEGRSVKDLRESMKADLGTAIEAVTLGVPLPETDKKAIADAVAAFLDNPNSLRAVAEAKEKITLGDAINGNPESLGKLKLTVTANP